MYSKKGRSFLSVSFFRVCFYKVSEVFAVSQRKAVFVVYRGCHK